MSSINLKVSEKKKYEKDGEWFKEIMNYLCPSQSGIIDSFDEMKNCYELVNMDLTSIRQKVEKFCNPLAEIVDSISDDLEPLPDLKTKIDVLKGELLKRKDRYVLTLVTDQAIQYRNEQQMKLVQESIDEKLGIELFKLQEQLKGLPEEEVQKLVQDLRSKLEPEDILQKDWLSDLEILFSKILKHAYLKLDIKSMMAETLEDAAITDRFYVTNVWKNGKPSIEITNPLQGQGHKDPNQQFTHKGNWFWKRKPITLTEAITVYNLSDDNIKSLDQRSSINTKYGLGGDPIPSDNMDFVRLFDKNKSSNDKTLGLAQTNDTIKHSDDLVWETHLEFIAYKSVSFLTYRDEYNKLITDVVIDFEKPDNATKVEFINRFDQKSHKYQWFDKILNTEFELEELWIPRKYEIVRLGTELYPVFREVPYQPINPDNPFDINLSTKGVILNARNAKSVSLVQRAIPLYLQLLYVTHIQNRELSKYQGFIHSIDIDQVPDDLGLDENGKQIRDKLGTYLAILRTTNRDIYSGTQTSLGGLPPSTRSPGSNGFTLGTATELMNLQNLKELIKREIGLAMGISPQRESNFSSSSNVSDNQQAIIQSHTITEPLFFKCALVWRDVLNDYLTAFRLYYQKQFEVFNQKELSEHIWLPDGSQELLKITPEHITHADIGLLLTNTSDAERYTELMLEQSFAFAQNQGQGIVPVSQLIKDIVSGASPEEVHKKIAILEQQTNERQQQMQQMQSEQQMQLEQMRIDAREDEQAHEVNLVRIKADLDLQRETIKSLGFAQETDLNNNQIPDVIDEAKLILEERKLDLKQQEFQHKKEMDKKNLNKKKV